MTNICQIENHELIMSAILDDELCGESVAVSVGMFLWFLLCKYYLPVLSYRIALYIDIMCKFRQNRLLKLTTTTFREINIIVQPQSQPQPG